MGKWYEIKLPSKIVIRGNDAVTYSTIDKSGKKTKHAGACYYAHMSKLSKTTFECFPNAKCILPGEDYLMWMRHCLGNGIMPMCSHFWTEGGKNYAYIDGRGNPKHKVYAALCCYRWSESLAPLCYTAVRLLELKPHLNFHQVLQFVMGKFVTLTGHSFSPITSISASFYAKGPEKTARTDLVYGLATKLFFQMDANGVCPAEKANQNAMTYTAMGDYVKSIGLSLNVKKPGELLDEKWIDFYNLNTSDKKQLKNCYDEIINRPKVEKAAE